MKIRQNALFALFILAQLSVCVWFGHLKRTFFCDETYSYGLANSENYSFLDPNSARAYSETGWVDTDYFKDYVMVRPKNRFSLRPPFENQKNDVHPPFYYLLLHFVCSLFPDTFTKWTGLALNFVIVVLQDFVLYYIAIFLFENRTKSLLLLALWSFSAAGLSNILFIRMYLLLTMEIFLYVAIHIKYIQKEMNLSPKEYAVLCLTVVLGGLTHYYFYPFVFFFSFPICVYFLFTEKLKKFFSYSLTLILGGIINICVFPASLQHVFHGYRGEEVLRNIGGRENVFRKFYLKWINDSFFAGTLKIFVALAIFCLVLKAASFFVQYTRSGSKITLSLKKVSVRKQISFTISKKSVVVVLSALGFIGFSFFAIVGSQIRHNRYIYPVYPALAIVMLGFLYYFFHFVKLPQKYLNVTVLVCVALLTFGSVKKYRIDFSYPEYDGFKNQAKQCKGFDCLIFWPRWVDIYTAFPLQFYYDETYFFTRDEIGTLDSILAKRKSADPIVVRLPEFLSNEEKQSILAEIEKATGYQSHSLRYKYYTEAYELIEASEN